MIFLIYASAVFYVTRKVKYQFTFKYYVNVIAFTVSMAINVVFGFITFFEQKNLIRYIQIPQKIEDFVIIYTFYSLLYEMRIVYLKLSCDNY